jgi:hypothetical protein
MNDSDRRLLTEAIGLKWFEYPEEDLPFGGHITRNLEFNSESELKVLLDKGPEQKWWGKFCTTLPKDSSLEDLLYPAKFSHLIVNYLKNGGSAGKRCESVI